MRHLKLEEFIQILNHQFGQRKLINHLKTCNLCMNKLLGLETFIENRNKTEPLESCSQFDETLLALYFENKLKGDEQTKYENHLLNCPFCFSAYYDLIQNFNIMKKVKQKKEPSLHIQLKNTFLKLKRSFSFPSPQFEYAPLMRGHKNNKIIKINFQIRVQSQNFIISIIHKSRKTVDVQISTEKKVNREYVFALYKKQDLLSQLILSSEKNYIVFENIEKGPYSIGYDNQIIWKGKID